MNEITEEEIDNIFEEVESDWTGDNFVQGVVILMKYYDIKNENIVQGADHDVVFVQDIEDLIFRGITREDIKALASLNWSYENGYLQCFV